MKNEKVQVDKAALEKLIDYVYEAELEDYQIVIPELEAGLEVSHIFNDIAKLSKNLKEHELAKTRKIIIKKAKKLGKDRLIK